MTTADASSDASASTSPLAAPIRRARPGDVPFVALVLETAARGHLARGPWDFLFPDDGERRVALRHIAGAASRSWCHHALFRIAEADGEAAALVSFEPGELGDGSLAAPLEQAFRRLGWGEERSASAVGTLAPYLSCFPDMPLGTWIVENVATREDARRRGLVRELLADALEEGRRRGLARAQISCLIGNDAAQRAYERAGFEVVEELRDAAFEGLMGSPGFSRMTRALEKP